MLVLSRKKGDAILIGDDIEVRVIKIDEGSVKLAITAPNSVTILREELYKGVAKENKIAGHIDEDLLRNLKK
jgi:carbon storage regulator